eukprot:g16366.t1
MSSGTANKQKTPKGPKNAVKTHPANADFLAHFEQKSEQSYDSRKVSRGVLGSLKRYPLEIETSVQAQWLAGVGKTFSADFERSGAKAPEGSSSSNEDEEEDEDLDPENDSDSDMMGGNDDPNLNLVRDSEKATSAAASLEAQEAADMRKAIELSLADQQIRFRRGLLDVRHCRISGNDVDHRSEMATSNIYRICTRTSNPSAVLPPAAVLHNRKDHSTGPPADLQNCDLVLLADTRESRAFSATDLSTASEMRALPLGDMCWVWRRRTPAGSDCDSSGSKMVAEGPQEEILAKYLVERKSVPDLDSSIRDGRYTEQKRRFLKMPQDLLRGGSTHFPGEVKLFYLVESKRKVGEKVGDLSRYVVGV